MYFFSKNRKVRDSSLHAKNNPEKHKGQFPFNSRQEIRFYESCGFIIFQGEIFVEQRVIACAMLTSKGYKSYQNNKLTVDSLQKLT